VERNPGATCGRRRDAVSHDHSERQIECSHLKKDLDLNNLAIEKSALEQENLFKKNEKQIAAVDSLNVKVGFSAAVSKQWEKNMSGMPAPASKLGGVAGFGGAAALGMSTKQIAEFNEGVKAIAELDEKRSLKELRQI
jgi:hypothetical protein